MSCSAPSRPASMDLRLPSTASEDGDESWGTDSEERLLEHVNWQRGCTIRTAAACVALALVSTGAWLVLSRSEHVPGVCAAGLSADTFLDRSAVEAAACDSSPLSEPQTIWAPDRTGTVFACESRMQWRVAPPGWRSELGLELAYQWAAAPEPLEQIRCQKREGELWGSKLNGTSCPVPFHPTRAASVANSCRFHRTHRPFSPSAARACTRSRWLLIIGDSTTRILFSALVGLLHNRLDNSIDPLLPNHRRCEPALDHDACAKWLTSNCAEGCIRDYTFLLAQTRNDSSTDICKSSSSSSRLDEPWRLLPSEDSRELMPPSATSVLHLPSHTPPGSQSPQHTRLTFVFKGPSTLALENPHLHPLFLNAGAQPDVIITNGGPWDSSSPPADTVAAADAYLERLQRASEAPIFWLDADWLNPADMPRANIAREYNKLMQPLLAARGIPLLQRTMQLNMTNNPSGPNMWAEEFHGWEYHGDLVAQQILNALCTQTQRSDSTSTS